MPRPRRGDRSAPALRAGLLFEGVRHTQLQLGASCCGVPCGPALWAFWTRLLASLWWGVIYAAVRHQICRATEPCSTSEECEDLGLALRIKHSTPRKSLVFVDIKTTLDRYLAHTLNRALARARPAKP